MPPVSRILHEFTTAWQSSRAAADLISCRGPAIVVGASDISLSLKGHEISCDRADGRADVLNAFGIFCLPRVSASIRLLQ